MQQVATRTFIRGRQGWRFRNLEMPLENEGLLDRVRNFAFQWTTYGPLKEFL